MTRSFGGTRYLQEVWLDTKTLPKEERDQYIIMAPTMGAERPGKDTGSSGAHRSTS